MQDPPQGRSLLRLTVDLSRETTREGAPVSAPSRFSRHRHPPPLGSIDCLRRLSRLGNGTSLVVAGEAIYPGEDVEMTPNAAQLRAVVGGAGEFLGARGQVETTCNDDGSYRHEFTLLDD